MKLRDSNYFDEINQRTKFDRKIHSTVGIGILNVVPFELFCILLPTTRDLWVISSPGRNTPINIVVKTLQS